MVATGASATLALCSPVNTAEERRDTVAPSGLIQATMIGHQHPSTRHHSSPRICFACTRRTGTVLAPSASARRFYRVEWPWVGHPFHRCCTKASATPPESGVFSSDVDHDSVLTIEHIRDQLKAQESPFAETNNWGGGYALYMGPGLPHNSRCSSFSRTLILMQRLFTGIRSSLNGFETYCTTNSTKLPWSV